MFETILFGWLPGILLVAKIILGIVALLWLIGFRYISHRNVGLVEKLWSFDGSLREGRIVALHGEAGFQADMLRGGVHFGYFPLQYRIHRAPLVVIPEGRLGYVYARDGEPLTAVQTLGRSTACNCFQDARAFLESAGQRGRQRMILREGVFAINTALFVVITEDGVYSGPVAVDAESRRQHEDWHAQLAGIEGFRPVVIGGEAPHLSRAVADQLAESGALLQNASGADTIGVVTAHDGPPIESTEIIAPEARSRDGVDHNYFQDPEAFLALGGRRGKQLQVLTDGTFFINRWFATVELRSKTLIPIGYVGVVVSYYGESGRDVTGESFRYGEQVEEGRRGVWKRPLAPGKYPLNMYAMKIELVPTVNFVLRWITGQAEAHQYDKDLTSIALITADGYEPTLPLSLVLHIDYEKAPRVIQRFGDVKRLISQTLDPILSAYFRDVAQSSTMLDLLTKREEIQKRATDELGRRFAQYDINCVAVLIGRPEARKSGDDPIERLFDQLRQRRLAEEQKETFAKQEAAAIRLKELNDAQAAAAKQTELTQTRVDIEIARNRGAAQHEEAKQLAEKTIAMAQGDSRAKELAGKGESSRIAQVGMAEAMVFLQKIKAYRDPRLFALNLVAEQFSRSAQPLVPERMMVMNNADGAKEMGVFNQLVGIMLSKESGIRVEEDAGVKELERQADALARAVGERKE